MFDHYVFRDQEATATDAEQPLQLKLPPAEGSNDKPWWDEYWTVSEKERDRTLFGI